MNISEAAEKYGITPATLRYYEKEGLLPPVTRNLAGNRDFNDDDLNWIEFIKCMRDAGLSVESLARYSKLYQEGEETLVERKEILDEEYQKLLEKQRFMNDTVARLEKKLAFYENEIMQAGKVGAQK
ncbi:MerR family transcriptional regulator [Listeria aquatica]|uniref:MerR family transcriptional regulator n=1 Tax=Listeria aquatica TaxID=1494960 RepID=UPI003F6FF669